jgi:carotenoid cleavage dioxygenase-like enzyme
LTGEILFDEFAELPTIDYERDAGLDYAAAYAAGGRKDRPEGFIINSCASTWGQSGATLVEDGCYPGEPVFVPRPNGADRLEGVIVSVVLDGQRGCSFLLVLDTQSFEEVGRAFAPHVIPFGFDGEFKS